MHKLTPVKTSDALNSALTEKGLFATCIKTVVKAMTTVYPTRVKANPPLGCAAHLRDSADLGHEFKTEFGKPIIAICFDARYTTPANVDNLTNTSVHFVEVPVSSQTGCASYVVFESETKNARGHSIAFALHTENLLKVSTQALAEGHDEVTFALMSGDDVSKAQFAKLPIDEQFIDELKASLARAKAFVPPTSAPLLANAKLKAEKYGEEPAMFLPYEVRPVGTALKFELRLALMRTMYNKARAHSFGFHPPKAA